MLQLVCICLQDLGQGSRIVLPGLSLPRILRLKTRDPDRCIGTGFGCCRMINVAPQSELTAFSRDFY